LIKFITENGGAVQIAEKLIELLEGVPQEVVKYKSAHALFWRFTTWESCSPSAQVI